MLDYSVIVPAYNEEKLLAGCLRSIKEGMKACEVFSGELLVVDNNSTDDTAQIALDFGARVIFEPVNQISRARNAGASEARGKVLIFVDGDTKIPAELLAETLLAMDQERLCGGGALVGTSDPLTGNMRRVIQMFNTVFSRFGYAAGAYVFCLREGWEETGGYSDKVYASEEIWFVRTLKRWGRKKKLRFKTIPIAFDTSMRKSRWYSEGYMLVRGMGIILCPFLLKSKRWCALWYRRPADREY